MLEFTRKIGSMSFEQGLIVGGILGGFIILGLVVDYRRKNRKPPTPPTQPPSF
jgi:hypothetical protein